MDPKVIGERIRETREKKGKTQLELAYESEVGLRTLARYEKGYPAMKVNILVNLASALDVPLETWLGKVRQPSLTVLNFDVLDKVS